MKNSIFRKKSIERISSPEQLNNYIEIARPAHLLILCAFVLFIISAIVWSIFGHLETSVPSLVTSSGGETYCYISEKNIASVNDGMTVKVGDESCELVSCNPNPILATSAMSDYAVHKGGFQGGEYVYQFSVSKPLKDGTYNADVITNSVHGISFLLN